MDTILEPKRGMIFLYSGTAISSWIVRFFTKSKYSHVGWFLGDNKILDADWDGIKIRDASTYLSEPQKLTILTLPLPQVQIEQALSLALRAEKKKANYDWRLVLSLFWAFIKGRRCHTNYRDSNKAFICSELVAEPLWKAAKFRFLPECYDIDLTTPQDIWETLKPKV